MLGRGTGGIGGQKAGGYDRTNCPTSRAGSLDACTQCPQPWALVHPSMLPQRQQRVLVVPLQRHKCCSMASSHLMPALAHSTEDAVEEVVHGDGIGSEK